MSENRRVRYYSDFSQDFVESKEQNTKLPEDYRYVRDGFFQCLRSAFTYGCALLFGVFFCPFHLHTKYVNRKAFKAVKGQGAFIYANHTQPVGDVVLPAFACFPRRIYTIVSPANLGIPFIGKQLPYLGALPIADTVGGMKEFQRALEKRIGDKKIVTVYPEAHVWEYCTMIRPYSDSSFKYPVKFKVPCFCMTVTYQKSKFFRRPRTTVFVDGPFYPDESLSVREQTKDLHRRVSECMKSRSKESNYDFIRYEKQG